jgi:para-aminobenzoate synthetase component 1
MTGAPKVRAMEIIESLEPVRRGAYAGAIGYFDAAGDLDLSVVIRTAVIHGDRVMVQLGGAVVADSHPSQELAETEAKGRLLMKALEG